MNKGKNYLVCGGASFLTGFLIGGIGGILYAPQSGVRTRRQLQNFTEDVKEQVDMALGDTKRKMIKAFENGRRAVLA